MLLIRLFGLCAILILSKLSGRLCPASNVMFLMWRLWLLRRVVLFCRLRCRFASSRLRLRGLFWRLLVILFRLVMILSVLIIILVSGLLISGVLGVTRLMRRLLVLIRRRSWMLDVFLVFLMILRRMLNVWVFLMLLLLGRRFVFL